MKPYWNHLKLQAPLMPTLTIKNIPEELYEQLRKTASAHHRSINSELIHCLEKTLSTHKLSATELRNSARTLRQRVTATPVDIEEINLAKSQGRE